MQLGCCREPTDTSQWACTLTVYNTVYNTVYVFRSCGVFRFMFRVYFTDFIVLGIHGDSLLGFYLLHHFYALVL